MERRSFSPNDLCFGPDGALYLTDSGVVIQDFAPNNKIRPDYMSVHYDGRVYRVDVPETGRVTKLDTGIKFTNGIAFGPDHLLYVNETLTGNIYRYERNGGPRVLFGNVIRPDAPAGWKGPDGMAFGEDGRLYVAVFGQRDVTVLEAEAKCSERISTAGILPTNVAFALPGRKQIHITEYEFGQMEAFDVACDGLPLLTGAGQLTEGVLYPAMPMKKFINRPENIVPELFEGLALAFPDKLRLTGSRLIARANPKPRARWR